ncbi:hypothetical protein C0J45_9339 [Silurus meridionalis]|nr:hypothetical protein C0J45_9339 [Silurus meridionalis]
MKRRAKCVNVDPKQCREDRGHPGRGESEKSKTKSIHARAHAHTRGSGRPSFPTFAGSLFRIGTRFLRRSPVSLADRPLSLLAPPEFPHGPARLFSRPPEITRRPTRLSTGSRLVPVR